MPHDARKRASDFDPRILEFFDGYVHGKISKRDFLSRAGQYAAAGVTGAMILEALQPNYALAQQVPAIEAPLLIHYAGMDERINAGWPAFEAALTAAGKDYEAHIYPGVNHGFHNDTTPRFDAGAAARAWQRTLAFFDRHLRG